MSTPDFFFRCQRSGNCCRVGTGRVWLKEGEAEGMASAAGMTAEAFAAQHLVTVDGRVSLRERQDGRCVLLEGQCHCTVYDARPQQCRDFPEWPGLQQDRAAFERAAAYCPGIQRLPEVTARARGLQALAELLPAPDADPGGQAPCLAAQGPRPASSLEVDAFLAAFPEASSDRNQACPALDGTHCTAGSARPAICRNLGGEEGLRVEREIQAAAENCGYPWSKADWHVILPDRAAAWRVANRTPLDV